MQYIYSAMDESLKQDQLEEFFVCFCLHVCFYLYLIEECLCVCVCVCVAHLKT